jgi:CRISPR/Cas system CMR subunit Cmr6 (Cas7 group RAMP superfamily)
VYVNRRRGAKEFEKYKMGKEIRIIKKGDHKKFEDYTFVDNNSIELNKIDNENDSNYSSSSNDKKNRREDLFKLRSDPKKVMKARNKSRLVGGHGTQSHSPIYE